MHKPRQPQNFSFWNTIARNEELVKKFLTKGNDRQVKDMSAALRYIKWENIQVKR